MNTEASPLVACLQRSRPFLLVALLALLVAGFLAAFLAHAPSRQLLWLVAYLVLVAGLAQVALGLGRAGLARVLPTARRMRAECLAFNAANVLVIGATLAASLAGILVGSVLFAVVLLVCALGTRGARPSLWLHAWRAGVLLLAGSALAGVILAVSRLAA